MKDIIFLPVEVIILFHEQLIKTYGGSHGIRDKNLLKSAIEQPKAAFNGRYLHDTITKWLQLMDITFVIIILL